MNNRLEAIARLVTGGRGLVDVGTDHGYLPVWLAKNGYTGQLYASDINPMPLSCAVQSAQEAALEDRIHFLLCDGLELCPPEEVDTIVIAGMGGDMICDILDRAEWCLNPCYTLILQPMTKAEVLRYWLCNNGFLLQQEVLVKDGAYIYQIIRASFSRNMPLKDAELFSGAFVNIRKEPLASEWLDFLINRFERERRGLSSAGRRNPGKLAICREILRQLKEMRMNLNDKSVLTHI